MMPARTILSCSLLQTCLLLSLFLLLPGCTLYSASEHAPYSAPGTAQLIVEVDLSELESTVQPPLNQDAAGGISQGRWTCDTIYLYPATEYGRRYVDGSVRGGEAGRLYSRLIRSGNSSDGSFALAEVPSGKYILSIAATRTIDVPSKEFAEQRFGWASVNMDDGPLTLKCAGGTLRRIASGQWIPSTVHMTEHKVIRKDIVIIDGESKRVPLHFSKHDPSGTYVSQF